MKRNNVCCYQFLLQFQWNVWLQTEQRWNRYDLQGNKWTIHFVYSALALVVYNSIGQLNLFPFIQHNFDVFYSRSAQFDFYQNCQSTAEIVFIQPTELQNDKRQRRTIHSFQIIKSNNIGLCEIGNKNSAYARAVENKLVTNELHKNVRTIHTIYFQQKKFMISLSIKVTKKPSDS